MRLKTVLALALAGVVVVLAGCAGLARERAEESEEAAGRAGPMNGDFWAQRLTYPTGRFEPAWLREAAKQDRAIAQSMPAGKRVDRHTMSLSPLALDPSHFTALGPKPLNDVVNFGFGHVSGRANVLKVDPIDNTVAYLGSDGGGVWKSTNCCSASTTWTIKTDFPEIASTAIDDIVIDPNNHNVVYAATGDLNYGSYSFGSGGVLKSTDQGETWNLLGADVFSPYYGAAAGYPQYQAVGKLAVDPNQSNTLVAATKTGLFFSYDAGTNWTGPCYTNDIVTNGQRQDMTGLAAVNDAGVTVLYAAVGVRGNPTPVQPDLGKNGANGVYKTAMPTTGCPALASWSLLNNGFPVGTGNGVPNTSRGRIELAAAPTDAHVLYAMISDIPTNGVLGVWRTADAGGTWAQVATSSDFGGCDGPGTQMWYDAGLTVDPNSANTVFASTTDLFRSTNGGDTFTNLTCGYVSGGTHVDHHARTFVGTDSNKMLIGSDGGVYYTANAGAGSPTFTAINDSINTIEIYSGDITGNFATSATPGAAGGFQDNGSGVVNYSGAPGAALWRTVGGGDGMFSRIEPVKGLRWYYSVYYGSIYRSTTGSTGSYGSVSGSWGAGGTGTDRKNFLMPFDLFRYGDTGVANSGCDTTNGCQRLVAGTYRLWESILGGTAVSWKSKTGDLTKNTLIVGADNRSFINQLHYSVSDVTIAIAGTSDGNVQYVYGLGSGTATGATAVNVTGANAVLPNRPVLNVTTDPLNPWIGYASLGGFDQNTPTTPGHVFRVNCAVNCASFTWENKTGNLPNIPVGAILANPKIPHQVFAGTDWGLYYTDDITAASPIWSRFESLPHAMIWDMVIDRGFTTLAVFTRSRGAWVWPLPDPPTGNADVSITLGGASVVQPGRNLQYTITVANAGPDPAPAVSVTQSLPVGLAWLGNSGDCSAAFPCVLASIAAGQQRVINVTACVPTGFTAGPAIVQASVAQGGDPNTANNTATLSLPIDSDVIFINGFDTCP